MNARPIHHPRERFSARMSEGSSLPPSPIWGGGGVNHEGDNLLPLL
jgi:hypothetical protein